MQHQLMQMQQQHPMVAAGFNHTNMTTEHIQQFLDENKSLILKILENQNSGKAGECAENQARLQRNLMYLAAIADCQPQMSFVYAQPGANFMQYQGSQQIITQSAMAAHSPTLYAQQQPHLVLQQQQSLHSQFGINFAATTGIHTLQSETTNERGGRTAAFSTTGDGLQGASRAADGASNQDVGSASSTKGLGQ